MRPVITTITDNVDSWILSEGSANTSPTLPIIMPSLTERVGLHTSPEGGEPDGGHRVQEEGSGPEARAGGLRGEEGAGLLPVQGGPGQGHLGDGEEEEGARRGGGAQEHRGEEILAGVPAEKGEAGPGDRQDPEALQGTPLPHWGQGG